MNFFQAIKSAFVRSFDYKTRSSRSEYWYFFLFDIILTMLLMPLFTSLTSLILVFFKHKYPHNTALTVDYIAFFALLVKCLPSFITVAPKYALVSRRFNDLNLNAKWLIPAFIFDFLIKYVTPIALGILAFIYSDKINSADFYNYLTSLNDSNSLENYFDIAVEIFTLVGILLILIYLVIFIIMMCFKGTSGSNKYGPNPLEKDNKITTI
ncbi:MAG: DUF805 domain-containing protein [Sphingobacteriia bacterium]|nr:DUF805 domain-containing protein [Sphingobacteriia bacterium]